MSDRAARLIGPCLLVLLTTALAVPALAAGPATRPGVIAPDDLLRVQVDDLSGPGVASVWLERVDPAGRVHLPWVGEVAVGGKSAVDAEAAVADAVNAMKLVQRPVVGIRRLQTAATATDHYGPADPGDLLRITLWDLNGPGREIVVDARVQQDGTVAVPYLAKAPKVAGLNPALVEQALGKAYVADRIVERPLVNVLRVESAATASVKLGPVAAGDLLTVTVEEVDGPGQSLRAIARVAQDGLVPLPYLAQPMKLGGLSEADAGTAVNRAYRDAHLVRGPGGAAVRRVESADRASAKPGPIAVGDLVRVAVRDLSGPGTTDARLFRVPPDGRIRLAYLKPMKVDGTTEADVAAAAVKAYKDERIVERASVSVLKVETPDDPAADLPDVPTKPPPAVVRDLLAADEAAAEKK